MVVGYYVREEREAITGWGNTEGRHMETRWERQGAGRKAERSGSTRSPWHRAGMFGRHGRHKTYIEGRKRGGSGGRQILNKGMAGRQAGTHVGRAAGSFLQQEVEWCRSCPPPSPPSQCPSQSPKSRIRCMMVEEGSCSVHVQWRRQEPGEEGSPQPAMPATGSAMGKIGGR